MTGLTRFATSTILLAAACIFAAPDAALACRLGIGDRVWHDANGNGIQDNGEPGLNDVRVTISPGFYLHGDPATNIWITSVVTAPGPLGAGDGYYLFDGVDCDVTYTIAIDPSTIPAGLTATTLGVGGDASLDSNDPAGTAVTLPNTGQNYSDLTIDFGFVAPACTGAIGNRVWDDANNNGIQDPGESNWIGAVVTLTQGGSIATDTNGEYMFEGLCAGTYQVCVATPPGAQPSPANQGGDDQADSDGVTGSAGVCADVNLPTSSTVDLSNDFGFYQPETGAPGTGTPGYWKTHPEAWPIDSITIGGRTYSIDQAIALMSRGQAGDKTYTMFDQLLSARLNVLIGNESACIAATIGLADEWMAAHPVASKVKGSSLAWKIGEPLAVQLDRYNNGMLCAPHRD